VRRLMTICTICVSPFLVRMLSGPLARFDDVGFSDVEVSDFSFD
jgi:hypothetical protein